MSDSVTHVLRKIYSAGIPITSPDLTNLGECINEDDELDVHVANFPATQPVSGSVSVSNFPVTQPISGSVSISGTPAVTVSSGTVNATCTGTVAVSNFPATQPISGSVSISGTPAVTVSSGSVNATCSGTVAVSNFPATQPVSGTVAVSSVSGTSAVSLSTLPCMYIPNGTNTLSSSTDKGNLCLTVEYGVGKFNPLVCNSTQRLLVADTDNKTVLDNILTSLNTIKTILQDIHDDAGNRIRVTTS